MTASVPRTAGSTRAARPPGRSLVFSWGDRLAFAAGILVTVLLVAFFSQRMIRNVTRDRALGPVPASTPTPPPPPPPSH